MSFDFSSLSTDTLLYFLTHSTVFVVSVASIFFIFGLAFGWLTWGRLKWQRRLLLSENESLKDEIATLKRKLAEQATRATSLTESAAPGDVPAREKHDAPDPVIHSFLSAAAAVLPQTSASAGISQSAMARSAATERSPIESPTGALARFESATPVDSPIAHDALPQSPKRKARLVSARDLAQKLGADHKSAPSTSPLSATGIAPTSSVDFVGTTSSAPTDEASSPSPAPPEPVVASNGHRAAAAEAHDPAAITNGEVPAIVARLPGNGEARLISDPHLGLIYGSRPALADDLNHLKGVAHIIEGRLNDFGVYTFKQIALWNDENISEFSHRLAFKDRIRRERWVEQARELHFQKYGERL